MIVKVLIIYPIMTIVAALLFCCCCWNNNSNGRFVMAASNSAYSAAAFLNTLPKQQQQQRKLQQGIFSPFSSATAKPSIPFSATATTQLFMEQPQEQPSKEFQNNNNNDNKKDINKLLNAIDQLFPPQKLQDRMAKSRKDGYWPFIQSGEEPPQELVYGEFDVSFFCTVLDRARELLLIANDNNNNGKKFKDQDDIDQKAVFCDMGSGTGRLVIAAAAWHSWNKCRGIELLEGIHDEAVEKLEACRRTSSSSSRRQNNNSDLDSTLRKKNEPISMIKNNNNNIQDAYWKQYMQYTTPTTATTTSITNSNDDWLTKLSNEFDSNNDDDEEEEESDGNLEMPQIENTNNDQESNKEEKAIDMASKSVEYELVYTETDDENDATKTKRSFPLSPIELSCGSFDDPYEFFGDSDIIFVFSTAMPFHILINLARAVGRQCQEGCLIITTEYQLPLGGMIEPYEDDPSLPHGPYELELVESFTGPCPSVGGESTVFIHRLTKSYGTGIPFEKPKLSVSDYAYKVVKDLESGKYALTPDPQTFLRNVSNQMIFIGLPDHWRPKLKNNEKVDLFERLYEKKKKKKSI